MGSETRIPLLEDGSMAAERGEPRHFLQRAIAKFKRQPGPSEEKK